MHSKSPGPTRGAYDLHRKRILLFKVGGAIRPVTSCFGRHFGFQTLVFALRYFHYIPNVRPPDGRRKSVFGIVAQTELLSIEILEKKKPEIWKGDRTSESPGPTRGAYALLVSTGVPEADTALQRRRGDHHVWPPFWFPNA